MCDPISLLTSVAGPVLGSLLNKTPTPPKPALVADEVSDTTGAEVKVAGSREEDEAKKKAAAAKTRVVGGSSVSTPSKTGISIL